MTLLFKKANICLVFIAALLLGAASNPAIAATYTVTTTNDADPFNPVTNSLRWAINQVNAGAGTGDVINFNIPGAGTHTITLSATLPTINKSVTIDGTTQNGYVYGSPTVILASGNLSWGIRIVSTYNTSFPNNITPISNSTVKGLFFTGFYVGVSVMTGFAEPVQNFTINDNVFINTVGSIRLGENSYDLIQNAVIRGNYIDATLASGPLSNKSGINLQASSSFIGGSISSYQNTITGCGTGVKIITYNSNLISRNVITSGTKAIDLYYSTSYQGNSGKPVPLITGISNGIVTGASQSEDMIEIFAGTAAGNANKYITTVTAAGGAWNVDLNQYTAELAGYNYIATTATDGLNNTSELSSSACFPPTVSVAASASSAGASATGGTITNSGAYTIHTFTTSGTFTPSGNLNVEYLVVGGGGGGGKPALSGAPGGGGGGAGGLRTGTLAVTATPYTITVGTGGAGSTTAGTLGTNGSNSIFSTVTATGGGGGGLAYTNGTAGGSGGGGSYNGSTGGAASPAGQGYKGGDGISGNYGGAGGGGAGAAGNNPGGSGTSGTGGNGGSGSASSISGASVIYAGGGGGGTYSASTAGSGGSGIGGNGGANGSNGANGTDNKGGGGGGGGATWINSGDPGNSGNGGNGGSGIIVIRYLTPASSCETSTTLTASGASTYAWSPATGLNATTGATVIATPTATTTYSVTGTNASGCTAIKTVTVSATPNPTITASPSSTICVGASAVLTVSAGATYLWNTGATTSGLSVNPSVTTAYSVTVTYAPGCTGTVAKTITVNPLPAITIESSYTAGTSSGGASATGGTITTSGGYTMHTFTTSGTYTFTPSGNLSVEYLVVAGGGGGGKPALSGAPGGGGGGAGGFRTGTLSVSAIPYTITVGAGGVGSTTQNTSGANGSNSVFSTVTATGGGGGGVSYTNASAGGSGGGGSYNGSAGGAASPAGQGNNGGNGISGNFGGAGGGGGGAAGNNPGGSGTSGTGGNGGTGSASSITGTSVTYAAGGGGGTYSTATPGTGGSSIGGNGASNGSNGANAPANTGSGGGGGGARWVNSDDPANSGNGGNGSSGIVVIRYLTPASSPVLCSGASAVLTAGGGTTYLWNTGSTSSAITVAPTSGTTTYSVTGTSSFGCTANASYSLAVNSNCNTNYSAGFREGTNLPPLNPNFEVGTTAGDFAVTQSGAATYSIPIVVPTGTQGMVPNLSVSYNSFGGDGLLGKGWSLSGLSSISRTGQSIYYNNTVAPVTLTNSDNFVMDGSYLIPATGNNGLAGTVYGTEMESFSRITSQGQVGNSPDYFTVETKNGTVLEFGHTADSRIESSTNNGTLPASGTALKWLLNKVTDKHGNYMTIQYYENNSTGEVYPLKIDYTGNSAAGLNTYNYVKFVYNTRTDKQTSYIAGTVVTSSMLLFAVEVHSLGNKVHEYNFSYLYEMGSHLSEVVEKGSDGKQFNSKKIVWNLRSDGPTFFEQSNLGNVTPTTAMIPYDFNVGDFNGDGFSDYLVIKPKETNGTLPHWYLYLNAGGKNGQEGFPSLTAHGDFPATVNGVAIGVSSYYSDYKEIFDSNGDGIDELLLIAYDGSGVGNGKPAYFTFQYNAQSNMLESDQTNGAKFTEILLYEEDVQKVLGDFDGDGATDIFVNFFFSTTNHYYIWSYKKKIFLLQGNQKLCDKTDKFLTVNIDGDSKDEIFYTYYNQPVAPDGSTPPIINGYYVFGLKNVSGVWVAEVLSNGSFPNHDYSINILGNSGSIYLGDFNGDGSTDLLAFKNSGGCNIGYAMKSSGAGTPLKYVAHPSPLSSSNPPCYDYSIYGSGGFLPPFVTDFDGDGKSDIAEIENNQPVAIHHSIGNNTFSKVAFSPPQWGTTQLSIGDYNGDGHKDFMSISAGSTGNAKHTSLYFNRFNLSKVTGIINGLNLNEVNISYEPLPVLANEWNGPNYIKETSAQFPVVDIQQPLYVTNMVTTEKGTAQQHSVLYSYAGAKIHLQGKNFLGFTKVASRDLSTNIKTENTYSLPASGTFFQRTLSSTQNFLASIPTTVPISLKTYTNYIFATGSGLPITDNSNPLKRYYFYADKYNENDQLHGNVVTTYTVTQDKWGNTTYTTSSNSAGTSSVFSTFEQKGAWIRSCLTSTTSTTDRTDPGSDAFTLFLNFVNNNFGDPVTKIENTGATTTYVYDNVSTPLNPTPKNVGNLLQTFISGIPILRSSENTYDSYGRYVVKQTNALNQSVQMLDHDAYGNVQTEIDANGISTYHTYDGFGRQSSTTIATSVPKKVSFKREWDSGAPGSLFKVSSSAPQMPTSTEYFDRYGRSLRVQTIGFNGTLAKVDKTYNALGELASVSEPYSGSTASAFTTYEYNDIVRRVTKITMPSAAYIDYSYSGNTTTSVAHQGAVTKTQTKTVDASGALISATDAGGTITYTYHSCGKPSRITPPGREDHSTYMTYDAYGRQISLHDPNANIIKYGYNALGELTHQMDAKQSVSPSYSYTITYDALGRVASKNSPQEGNIIYTYDDPNHGIGMIDQITGTGTFNNVNYNYDYNAQGLLAGITENMGADGVYVHSYEYDEWNRLKKEIYPGSSTRFAIGMEYNNYGYLEKIRNASTSSSGPLIWQCDAMDVRGQVTDALSGTGLYSTKTYSSLGYLQRIVVGTENLVVWDQGCTFNETTGNLTSRTDNLKGQSEVFQYDNLDRLTDTYLNGGSSPVSNVVYNDLEGGNIFQKNEQGTMEYEYHSLKPHALTRIGTSIGNIPTVGQSISYTPFNRASTVTEYPHNLQLNYGPDHERKKSVLTNTQTGSTVRTVIYSGNYEKITKGNVTYEVYYVNTPDGLRALNVRTNAGSNSMKYVYTDHLGSIGLICEVLLPQVFDFQQSFDAWGRGRNPANWANSTPATAPDWLIRGYTGHEHHKEFGLINMNARLYDPAVGRMLSPDNEVQSPEFTQSYNRYSYAFNNPLKYIDPNGNHLYTYNSEGRLISVEEQEGQDRFAKMGEDGLVDLTLEDLSSTMLDLYEQTSGLLNSGEIAGVKFSDGFYFPSSEHTIMLEGVNVIASSVPFSEWAGQIGLQNKPLETPMFDPIDLSGGLLAGGMKALFSVSIRTTEQAAVQTGTRAFFSGAGMEEKAIEQGFKTLGQTRAGKNLQNLIDSKNIPWKGVGNAEEMWKRLSAVWAKGVPKGSKVPAFLNNPRADAIWFETELPLLQLNKVNIIYK